MATRGRKPKPTAMKILEGNPGKRDINYNEPKTNGHAECPDWLEPEAKKEWNRLSKKLENLGILSDTDTMTFASYCQAYAGWKEAAEKVMKHGKLVKTPNGFLQKSPFVEMEKQYNDQMLKIATEFGLTPSSRGKLLANEGDFDEYDEMENILRGGGFLNGVYPY